MKENELEKDEWEEDEEELGYEFVDDKEEKKNELEEDEEELGYEFIDNGDYMESTIIDMELEI